MTLVTVLSSDMVKTVTISSDDIASTVLATFWFASAWVTIWKIIVILFALVTKITIYIGETGTGTGGFMTNVIFSPFLITPTS